MLQDGEWERACDELGRKMLDDTILHTSDFHRTGWWENLQETPIFNGKNHGFL